MNLKYSFCVLLLLFSVSSAQDLSQSKVIREISQEQDGRMVTVTEIEPPILKKEKAVLSTQHSHLVVLPTIPQSQVEEAAPQKTFTVMATTYDKRITKLTITPQAGGQSVEAWSNINWNHLISVSGLEGEQEAYSMLLLQSNASLKALRKARKKDKTIQVPKVPRNLPKLKKKGPHYTLKKAPTTDQEEILNFLETIHNHYAEKEVELVEAHKLREKQVAKKKKELVENPPKPEDMKIIFWNNDSNLPK